MGLEAWRVQGPVLKIAVLGYGVFRIQGLEGLAVRMLQT